MEMVEALILHRIGTYHQRYPYLINVDESPSPPAHDCQSHKEASLGVEALTCQPPFLPHIGVLPLIQ